jgi:glyoxylase-like metal-dependent hydrolase (beta-lactamase superfamily II)
VVIRQSLRTSPEGPFIVLLFGNDRALLLDTGHGKDPDEWPLRRVVDVLIESWLTDNPHDDYHLVVAHSHAHADHTSGDDQFSDRSNTTVVGVELADVQEFFGLADWPEGSATFDLGGRKLNVLPVPGHHETSIAIVDPYTGLLLSGDTVYPGRIYVRDTEAFLASTEKLAALAESGDVSLVLGGHIELDRDGREYALGVRERPEEGSSFLPSSSLVDLREAAREVANTPGVHRFDGFVIYNGNRVRDQVGLVARSLWARIRTAGYVSP